MVLIGHLKFPNDLSPVSCNVAHFKSKNVIAGNGLHVPHPAMPPASEISKKEARHVIIIAWQSPTPVLEDDSRFLLQAKVLPEARSVIKHLSRASAERLQQQINHCVEHVQGQIVQQIHAGVDLLLAKEPAS